MISKRVGPGRHPYPPADLVSRSLPLISLSQPWYRIHKDCYEAVFFGHSGEGRFDALEAEYGVLYVSADIDGAFIEGCIRDTGLGRAHRVVSMSYLLERVLSRITFAKPLDLVDLTSEGLARIGADMRLCTAGGYRIAQRWSRAFYRHPEQPDGILYCSRHDPSCKCAALFDRIAGPTSVKIGGFLDPPLKPQLGALLDKYDIGLV